MAKDKSEKKEKKEKKVAEDGVKKDKKEKKEKRKSTDATTAVLNAIEDAAPGAVAVDADGDITIDGAADVIKTDDAVITIPKSALVPFANPLCDEKSGKKVLKTVKKATKQKCLKRGVKEVVKAVRKTPPGNPSVTSALPPGIVVLAADISPIDVISHIPVLCEDHNIPYVYLTSRAELGAAGSTKRPTSVVMVTPKSGGKKKDGEAADDEEWAESFKDLNKLALKLGQHVKV